MSRRSETGARVAGLVLGLVGAGALVAMWWVPGGTGSVGARITFAALPTGELGVTPAGTFLRGTELRPSDSAEGTFDLLNQTGVTLSIQLRGVSSGGVLDQVLQLDVAAGDGTIFSGNLAGFADWTDEPITLRSGEGTTLEVRAWIPATVTEDFEGRVDQVTVEFDSRPVGG